MRRLALVVAALGVLWPAAAGAQTYDVLGTRAAGMAGAFVGVADDASAVYWNPGGLASGAYFSLLLDYVTGEADPDSAPRFGTGSRSSGIIALSTPVLGLSYYRLRQSASRPTAAGYELENLITHHTGLTLVQSLTEHIAVGSTLKLVRGAAATALTDVSDRDPESVVGRASTHFDLDAGVMATYGAFRAGVAVRNITEPSFDTLDDDAPLTLDRQARAGLSYVLPSGLLVALDMDLTTTRGSIGESRMLAAGAEARLGRRVFARGGVRVNTLDEPVGRAPAVAVGGSVAATAALFVDGQVTMGSPDADRGWGIAARLLF
jgi:F plasmid transfer operon, TraF, protein